MIKAMQIGYGYWGSNVARKLRESGKFDFVCLAETNPKHRSEARKSLPDRVAVIDDYKKMTEEVDLVIICTQTEYSYEIAMDVMAKGKHVFMEKPLAENVEKAQNLIRMAEKNRLILHCDHLMVYNPVIRYIKRMLDNGEVGDIMYIDVSRINLGPVRKDINAMLDLAVHDIAVIDFLIGGLVPDDINVFGTKFFGEQETLTYLSMKCGEMLVNINSSWISPVKVRRMTIGGTKKMLIFDDVKMDKLRIYNSGIDVKQGAEYGEYEFKTRVGDIFIPRIDHEDALLNSLEHFAGCITDGKVSLSGPEPSLRVMKVLEKAQEMLKYERK